MLQWKKHTWYFLIKTFRQTQIFNVVGISAGKEVVLLPYRTHALCCLNESFTRKTQTLREKYLKSFLWTADEQPGEAVAVCSPVASGVITRNGWPWMPRLGFSLIRWHTASKQAHFLFTPHWWKQSEGSPQNCTVFLPHTKWNHRGNYLLLRSSC